MTETLQLNKTKYIFIYFYLTHVVQLTIKEHFHTIMIKLKSIAEFEIMFSINHCELNKCREPSPYLTMHIF